MKYLISHCFSYAFFLHFPNVPSVRVCVGGCEAMSLCVWVCVCVFCHLKTEAKCCERAQLNEDPRVVSLPLLLLLCPVILCIQWACIEAGMQDLLG